MINIKYSSNHSIMNIITSKITNVSFIGNNEYNLVNNNNNFVITGTQSFVVYVDNNKATIESKGSNDINMGEISIGKTNISGSVCGIKISGGNICVGDKMITTSDSVSIGTSINDGSGDKGPETTYNGVKYFKGLPSNCCPLVINNNFYYTKPSQTDSVVKDSDAQQETTEYATEWIFEQPPCISDISMSGMTSLTTNESSIFDTKIYMRMSGSSNLKCDFTMTQNVFDVEFTGSGSSDAVFNGLFNNIRINSSGSSNCTISSSKFVENLSVFASGSSRVHTNFISHIANVSTSGSSVCHVNVEKNGNFQSSRSSRIYAKEAVGANIIRH